MARCIDLLAAARDGPTAVDGFYSSHHPAEILGDGQITAHQFLQGSQAVVSVIDRAQLVVVQQFGQLPGVHAVILVAFLQQGIPTRIADHHFPDRGLQEVVQPGPSSFLKRDVHVSAQPFEKLQNRARFRLDDAFHHDLPSIIPDRDRNAFLVHVHADILSASHKGVPLWKVEFSTQNLLQKGHPFILRRVV